MSVARTVVAERDRYDLLRDATFDDHLRFEPRRRIAVVRREWCAFTKSTVRKRERATEEVEMLMQIESARCQSIVLAVTDVAERSCHDIVCAQILSVDVGRELVAM